MKIAAYFLLLLPILAFPISKVGNSSIGSDRSGFSVDMPYPFLDIQALKGNAVRLTSIVPEQEFDPAIGFFQSYIEAKDFDEMYPDLRFTSLEETRAWFLSRGWSEVETSQPCMFAAQIEKPAGITVVTSWGPSIGAVFYGPARAVARKALGLIPAQIMLKDGACRW